MIAPTNTITGDAVNPKAARAGVTAIINTKPIHINFIPI